MTTNELDNRYASIREEEREALSLRVAEAFSRVPRLAALDEARRSVFSEVGQRTLSPDAGKRRLAEIELEERALLLYAGMAADALTLHERCEICHDTGYVGTQRKPCACRLLMREKLRGGCGVNERETFAQFRTDLYPDAEQRKRAVRAKEICMAYAAALPVPEKPNLLILGKPGLGKSYLGNAIAHEALCSGMDAARITAYAFVQDVLSDIRAHTDHAKRFQSVPLLVLDDLGSEPDIPNVSVEWLFAVVNERVMAGRASVCITNLSLAELQARYGERLMSRLCDRGTTIALRLEGQNLRVL